MKRSPGITPLTNLPGVFIVRIPRWRILLTEPVRCYLFEIKSVISSKFTKEILGIIRGVFFLGIDVTHSRLISKKWVEFLKEITRVTQVQILYVGSQKSSICSIMYWAWYFILRLILFFIQWQLLCTMIQTRRSVCRRRPFVWRHGMATRTIYSITMSTVCMDGARPSPLWGKKKHHYYTLCNRNIFWENKYHVYFLRSIPN